MSKPEQKNWYATFVQDQASTKFQDWLIEAQEARQLCELDLNPLQKYGLDPTDGNPWMRSGSIARITRDIKGRAFRNSFKPKVVPYEGKNVEEDVTKICDCIFSFETQAKRGPFNLNFIRELSIVSDDSIIAGMGYIDMRIDGALCTPTFFNGLPIYQRFNPTSVVLDERAGRLEEILHLHIVQRYTPENLGVTFDVDPKDFPKGTVETIRYITEGNVTNDSDYNANLIEVIETQYLKLYKDRLLMIPQELSQELQVPPGAMWYKDLEKHIELLGQQNDSYKKYPLKRVVKYIQGKDQVRWGVYSTFYVGDKPLNDGREYFLGTTFSIMPLQFIRITNSPYGHGAPYFLADPQKLEILANTKLAQLVMKSNRSRVHTKGHISQETKDQLSDSMADVIEYGEMADCPPNEPLSNLITFEKSGEMLPWLINFVGHVHGMLNEEFGTRPEQEGGLPYAGAPAKLIDKLMTSGAIMFATFQEGFNWFLPNVYERVLGLATKAIPIPALIMLAGENDEERRQLIESGELYSRLETMNVDVQLDLTSDQERLMQKQLYAELYKAGQLDPETAMELLEVEEPQRIARAIRANSQALQIGTDIMEDPNLQQVILPIIDKHKKSVAAMQQIKKR